MPEFFYGWRRKVGCSLLLVAIGLCTLWARSELVEDNISIPNGDRRHQVTLLFGRVIWETWDRTPTDAFAWNSQVANYDWLSPWVRSGLLPAFEFAGFEYGGRHPEFAAVKGHFGWVVIPYAWLVLPLTLLAAYLILRKPPVVKTTSAQTSIAPPSTLAH